MMSVNRPFFKDEITLIMSLNLQKGWTLLMARCEECNVPMMINKEEEEFEFIYKGEWSSPEDIDEDVIRDICQSNELYCHILIDNNINKSYYYDEDDWQNYEVNVILDNKNQKRCPVVIETSPTYQNLFGVIEKFSDGNGGWYSDFTKIKTGSLLRANGGYLILNADWKIIAAARVAIIQANLLPDNCTGSITMRSIMKPIRAAAIIKITKDWINGHFHTPTI